MDMDRCGHGTPWGCGEHLPVSGPVKILVHAVTPISVVDNGHRMFHPGCFEEVAPMATPYSHRLTSHGA